MWMSNELMYLHTVEVKLFQNNLHVINESMSA